MKLTIFALIAGLCLAAVQAGRIVPESFHANDVNSFDDTLAAAGSVEPDTQSLVAGFYWILKGALKTSTGLKCTAKEVNTILTASQTFLTAVDNCPGKLSDQVVKIVTGVKQIVTTSQGFSSIDQTYCKSNSQSQSGWNCFWKMLRQSLVLTNQIGKVVTLLIKLPTSGSNSNSCVNSNIYQLHYSYSSFSTAVTACKTGK